MATFKALAAIRHNGKSIKPQQTFDADPQNADIRFVLETGSIVRVDQAIQDITILSCENLPTEVLTAAGTTIATADLVVKAMIRVGLTVGAWNALPAVSRASAIGDLQSELTRLFVRAETDQTEPDQGDTSDTGDAQKPKNRGRKDQG